MVSTGKIEPCALASTIILQLSSHISEDVTESMLIAAPPDKPFSSNTW